MIALQSSASTVLNREQLNQAQMGQRETGYTLEAILITFGFCSPDTVLSDLAQQRGLPLMLKRDLAAQVTGLIHTESVFRHRVLPLIITPFSLRVTIAIPTILPLPCVTLLDGTASVCYALIICSKCCKAHYRRRDVIYLPMKRY